jgi:DNA-binding MarR family transcriptional regulator
MQATGAATNVSPETLATELHEFWMSFMRQSAPAMYRVLEELDLSMTQMKTLHALDGSAAECTVKETAEATGFSLPNASRTVDSLLKRGYLERREDELDRRQKRLRLTEAGRAALEQIAAARLAGLEQYTAALSAEQRDGLYAALQALPHHDRKDPA